MRARLPLIAVALLVFFTFTLTSATPAAAQFGGLKNKLKEKVEKKVDQKTDQTIDKAIEGEGQAPPAEAAEPAPTAEASAAADQADDAKADGAKASATVEDMTLYTKFDFVPGDKVLFYDDLSREEQGEFPSRWNLDHGVFEIAKAEGRNWILCSDRGIIAPKIAPGPLPEKYTIEMEFYSATDQDGWYTIRWLGADGSEAGHLSISYSSTTSLVILGKELASKGIVALPRGRHVMRIMATKSTIKCYIDQERVANVPKVEGFTPVGFQLDLDPFFQNTGVSRLGTFRYAEGGKTLREQLEESGRIVTHGILFDSGSDRIKAESFKTLTDIGTMLTDDPSLRLSIEGHTDADGADDANLALSQSRAAAVRAYLRQKHGLAAERIETKGWGESAAVDSNETPEGKANNRRVELVKL
jgi:outer membrane protein OmpA-like peptidoglycan-associated protein